jgi:hypothetical protein
MWDQRGERSYYYRCVRVNGKPRRRYVGTGEAVAAQQAAAEDERRRQERLAAEAELEAELAHLQEVDALVDKFCRLTDQLLAAELMEAGYEQRQGRWRPRHGSANRSEDPTDD